MTDRNLYNEKRVVPLEEYREKTERTDWRQPSLSKDDGDNNGHIPEKQFTPTNLPDTYQTVCKEGGFEECVHVTDQAYEELIDLATHERTKEKWSKESMSIYLQYTWIRLMEQHRVLNASATQAANFKKILESAGISDTFAVFNTGLVNRNDEDIFAVLVQSTPGKYEKSGPPYTLYQSGITLQHSGICVTTEDNKALPFIEYLQMWLEKMEKNDRTDNPLVYHNKSIQSSLRHALKVSLKKSSFFNAPDEKLHLDWKVDIKCNEAYHIIRKHLDCFLEAGVIDGHEAIIVDQEEWDRFTPEIKKEFSSLEYKGQKKFIRKYKADGFYFRRQNFGVNACALKLNQWIADAKRRVQGTFALAVPQIYYEPINDKYTGRLQLLIPLFCGTNKAKLALGLDYICKDTDRYYSASTVLKIRWAYSNARLLTAPQATWILQDMA